MRSRLNCGGTSNNIEAFDDLLNSSSHKVRKTKVDVRSENARKFRDMFDKGKKFCKTFESDIFEKLTGYKVYIYSLRKFK